MSTQCSVQTESKTYIFNCLFDSFTWILTRNFPNLIYSNPILESMPTTYIQTNPNLPLFPRLSQITSLGWLHLINLFPMSVVTALPQDTVASCWDQNNSLLLQPWSQGSVMLHPPPSSTLILLPHLWFFSTHKMHFYYPVYCVCNVNFKNTPNPLWPLELQMQFSLPERFFLEFPFYSSWAGHWKITYT